MSALGYVSRDGEGYKGEIELFGQRRPIQLIPNRRKAAPEHPDFQVNSDRLELGGAWVRTGEMSGKEYVRMAIARPEFGPHTIYANLGRAAGQDDDDVFAIIWNPMS
ncbi:DUF736 domain-containing protein [Sphingobium fuliginis]|uniref:DUF736 domain-containing protein n=1 Tax=Sphingobium fuliginis ATCC 27551 TaxID=1208342 RepID=A0A5B8CG42_SPHSA|nr:DUF736 domain-containing protein [Sphingobium fuliginis]QDC37226.1 DUF736 domain-containing protein [Sphingobium fuliginis ATCC 27551]